MAIVINDVEVLVEPTSGRPDQTGAAPPQRPPAGVNPDEVEALIRFLADRRERLAAD